MPKKRSIGDKDGSKDVKRIAGNVYLFIFCHSIFTNDIKIIMAYDDGDREITVIGRCRTR